jgi:phosphoesterase RecJ-like protein
MTNPTRAPEPLLQRLRQGARFLISSHINPDGDAIGSQIGLVRVLRGLGKSSVIWNLDRGPALYRPLPGSDRIHTGSEPPSGFPDQFDAAIVLECPTLDRTGLEARLTELALVNIDHHLGNAHYAEINWVDTAAPAVGEMIYRLAQGLKVPLDPDTATALYLTLVTDTGGFRFANATPAAFEAAASLVREGARPERVAEWLYESQPEATVRLLGEMLGSLRIDCDGKVATALLTSEMFARSAADASNSEGLVDVPRSISGVQAVGLLRQVEPGRFKVSLRSRGEVDVERLARRHGGGGHRNAAGFVLDGSADEVRALVVTALREALG